MIDIIICPWCEGLGRRFIVKHNKSVIELIGYPPKGYYAYECPDCEGTGCIKEVRVDHQKRRSTP